MAQQLVKVASFTNAPQAYAARVFLQAQGIPAVVTGEASATTMSHIGAALGGVQLFVHQEQADRALELIREFSKTPPALSGGNLKCPACGEKFEPGFEVCWKCGATLDGQSDPSFRTPERDADESPSDETDDDDDQQDEWLREAGSHNRQRAEQLLQQSAVAALDREPPADAPAWVCPACGRRVATDDDHCWNCGATHAGNFNPFQSPTLIGTMADAPDTPQAASANQRLDAQATRAWRTAVIGIAVCPPILNLYSLWLSLDLFFSETPLSPFAKKRLLGTFLINTLLVALIVAFKMDALFMFAGLIRFFMNPLR